MERLIDLHVHSCFSDGTDTPERLVCLAREKRLSAIALTDHDTTAGIPDAIRAASGHDVELIPGIEISCLFEKKDIHLTGLFIDCNNERLSQTIHNCQNERNERNRLMAEKLTAAGFPVSVPELEHMFPRTILTRAHFARFLTEKGFLKIKEDAFKKYIGEGCPCYVEKRCISPGQAIDIIHNAGGLAVLAHPFLYHMTDQQRESMVSSLKNMGLDGIETMYATFSEAQQTAAKRLAFKYHLLQSGGSDYHGANKPGIFLGTGFGNLYVPAFYLEIMKKYLKKGAVR